MTRSEFRDLCRATDCLTLHLATGRGLSPEGRAAARVRLRFLLECLAAAAGRGIGPDERGLAARVAAAAQGGLGP